MTRQIKLLIVFPRVLWQTKMSPARKHQIQAIGRDVENFRCWLSGPGFAGWDDSQTLAWNAKLACGGETPDVIRAYKPMGSSKYGFKHLHATQHSCAPICLAYNETWDAEWTTRELRQSHASFAIFHHENGHEYVDLPKYHIPHAAEKSIFYSENEDRPIDVLLTGAIGENHYPLRVKFRDMIQSGALKGLHCVIRPHPGYEMRSEGHWNQQLADYALALGRSKVVLCCTSRHRYALAKLMEAAAAGALVVTDLPDDQWWCERFANWCAVSHTDRIGWDDSLAALIRSVCELSGRPGSANLQPAYLAHATCEHYAARFARACRHFLGWDSTAYAP